LDFQLAHFVIEARPCPDANITRLPGEAKASNPLGIHDKTALRNATHRGGIQCPQTPMFAGMPALLDRFVPHPDVMRRHETTVHAPAQLVMRVASSFEIESIWMVHALFRLRAALLRAPNSQARQRLGLVAQMRSIGWQCLAEDPHYYVAGAACQPWRADPAFSPVTTDDFTAFAAPDRVKIAWTLEVAELAPALTLFATETRAVATDDQARIKFRRYWRKFGAGIVLIRIVLLPALRRRAERLWRERSEA
jgi:hypothetical protein